MREFEDKYAKGVQGQDVKSDARRVGSWIMYNFLKLETTYSYFDMSCQHLFIY